MENTVTIIHRRHTPPLQLIHVDLAKSEDTIAMCRESVQAVQVSNDVNSAVPHMLRESLCCVAKLLLDFLCEAHVTAT